MAAPERRTRTPRVIASTSRLVPAKRASAEYGLAYTTMRDAVQRGELPVVKISRAWYFDRRDLDKWIDANKTTSAA